MVSSFARLKKLSNRHLFLLTIGLVSLNLFIVQKGVDFTSWRSVMRTDQAGYYVYLPATFIYGFDATEIKKADSIEAATGNGFSLDNGMFETKYPYGVSLLQAPFFLGIHAYVKISGMKDDGFSKPYHFVLYLSALFYFLLGIRFLFGFLIRYADRKWVILSIFLVTYGTNIYYYALDTSGMSHVYSFMLFSAILFYMDKYSGTKGNKSSLLAALVFIMLSVLVRPTNILIVLLVFFWNVTSREDMKKRIGHLFSPPVLIPFILISILMIIPQLMYWKYLSGSYLYYAYEGEGFIHILQPRLAQVLFAPFSGLIPYNPVVLIFLIATGWYIRKHSNALLIFSIFGIALYLTASWHMPEFGCSYGARNLSEYLVLFSLPLLAFLKHVDEKGGWQRQLIFVLTIIFVLVNQRLAWSFDKCYFYEIWDYTGYFRYFT